MKIKPEDYETLRGLIEPVIARVPVADYQKANPTFSAKRIRWDYYWSARASLAQDDPLRNFVCDVLYKYMNDTHIDTALKSIVGV